MKLAIIGSRNLIIKNIDNYMPQNVSEIVSGGARGADFARRNNLKLTEFLPKYSQYGRIAPLKRNEEIADYADEVLAFWNGYSRGTVHTIKCFEKLNKKVTVIVVK